MARKKILPTNQDSAKKKVYRYKTKEYDWNKVEVALEIFECGYNRGWQDAIVSLRRKQAGRGGRVALHKA